MKKLRKTTLDELAKKMPVLSENEQRSSIGGYRYYDESGQFIDQIGSSNEIRFINRCYYDSTVMNGSSESLISQSSSFSDGTPLAREGAVRQIAANLGISIQPLYGESTTRNGECDGKACYINMNSTRVNGGNFYDIGLIAIHEKCHLDNHYNTGVLKPEAEAYKAMMQHSYFDYASPSYQNHIANQYNKHK